VNATLRESLHGCKTNYQRYLTRRTFCCSQFLLWLQLKFSINYLYAFLDKKVELFTHADDDVLMSTLKCITIL